MGMGPNPAAAKSVTIQIPVDGGNKFFWTVDETPCMFTAPPGKKKGDSVEFTFSWDPSIPTADGKPPPAHAPGGGQWFYKQKYAGPNTQMMCCLLCLMGGVFTGCGAMAFACPTDERDVYKVKGPGEGHMLTYDINGKLLSAVEITEHV